MAFFSPKTWKQRIVEFPGRRRLDDTSTADVYDVSRAEGIVTQEGDGFTAVNMNDLEQRINNAVNDVAGLNAEEYDPKSTYKKGALRTNNNALWKAKENIDTPEQWTPEHWDSTTIAKELEENRDASKVTYNNESSSLTAQTVQEAIDENAEAISALNSSLDGKLPLISLNSATADNYRDGARAIYGEIRYGRGRSFGIEYQYTAGDKTYGAQLIINYTDGVMLRKLEDSVWGEWTAIS